MFIEKHTLEADMDGDGLKSAIMMSHSSPWNPWIVPT